MVGGFRILAHRGATITGPENTMEAVHRCRQEGADAVELDVRLSADGEPVIFHDEDARRLAGVRGRIRDLRWKDIRELKVFGRHPVPHLDDVLGELERWPGAELFLDLHENRLDLPSVVAARVAKSPAASRTFLLAFYWHRALLLRAREVFAAVRLSVMPGPPWNIGPSLRLGARSLCLGWDGKATRWVYRAASGLWDSRAVLAPARQAGIGVSAGVANTPEDIAWLAAQGFTELWTDDLAMARRVLSA